MKGPFLTLLFFVSFFCSLAQEKDHEPVGNKVQSANQALELLLAGNKRFLEGTSIHPHENRNWIKQLEGGQNPFAVVIGCSDSRVPPELVFDQGFGDIFVIRIAGNVVDTDVLASVEYALEHLGTQLIMVLGHTECGAVKATISHLNNPEGEPSEIVSLLYQIEPAVMSIESNEDSHATVAQVVKRNVELSVRRLSRAPDIRKKFSGKQISIKGAIYDISTGKVTILE